jgi:hypothetical protein
MNEYTDTPQAAAPALSIPQRQPQAAPAVAVYDARARQRLEFDLEDGETTLTVTVEPIPDEVYLKSFDAKAAPRITDGGKSMVVSGSAPLASLFDAVVADIEGIPGEKPADWKEVLDEDQIKAPIMANVVAVSVYDEGFAWGQTSRPVVVESFFNGEIVKARHYLRKKDKDDVREYRNLQKIPLGARGKGLAGGDMVLPAHTEKKAKLYDRMTEREPEGYAGGRVPVWHKAAVVDHIFAAGVSAKK